MRQHTAPLLLEPASARAVPLEQLSMQAGEGAVSEAAIQELIHAHPDCLPLREIDAGFADAVSICRELSVPGVGAVDNLLVTPSGNLIVVECKLWRNPEGRREVVGQILDYAKELSRWSVSDLQREVARRHEGRTDALLQLVREKDAGVDELEFNDALSRNLRQGRFLLLIVGDGIREGVEAIAEYIQGHAGLHFSLGLVELPVFLLPDGRRLVAPRVLARTHVVVRNVIAVPEGYVVAEDQHEAVSLSDPDRAALGDNQRAFWTEFLRHLRLDDPEQAIPKPPRTGFMPITLPAQSGSSWLTVFRNVANHRVGVQLSSSRNSPGDYAMQAVVDDIDAVLEQLGGTAQRGLSDGRPTVADSLTVSSLNDPAERERAFQWLAERVNTFVNVLRPRVRSAASDCEQANG